MRKYAMASATLALAAALALGGNALAGKAKTITKSYETDNPATIPSDGGNAGLELPSVNVSQKGKIKDVDVRIRGVDDQIGAVELTLLPPRGAGLTVFRINAVNVHESIGSGGPGCDGQPITLNDSASRSILDEDEDATGSYKPAEKLSALKGRQASGTWRLLLEKPSTDNDGGAISCFGLKIKTRK